MTKRMLIDATQPEETRVVLTDGNRVDDFDFEVAHRKNLRGNIYLARIIRVEPSLQAAFVEYGGNRHGFLALNEIHPDYYRIPVEDRQALLEAQDAHAVHDPDDPNGDLDAPDDDQPDADGLAADASEDGGDGEVAGDAAATGSEAAGEAAARTDSGNGATARPRSRGRRGTRDRSRTAAESAGRTPDHRRYKIQEVIARRQIMLVQVVKDERGNKGAALSTYLSLAGRYCVLMPNTPRGGGVSRKIVDGADRKRLRTVVEGLDVTPGMGVIVRTAGSGRNKTEIRRDYDYLLRLWEQIRELTLNSIAPCLIHEEANLIRRSIRDLYTRDIEEVLVEGEDGYRTAKDFMKTLVPSHARRIKRFSDGGVPMFHHFQVESQLGAIHATNVQLRSGGSIVLNQTEALVAIDVNSGRATRERNIEETAVKTNLEAAAEIARQLRLRDLAGLVVIDFIDMDGPRNQQAVERKMKEEVKNDRARIQLGRISQFGLMEMSRQRLRPSIAEASTVDCPRCEGTGRIRSVDSAGLQVLRSIEEEGLKQRASDVLVRLPSEIGFYILNHKRDMLARMEDRYAFAVKLAPDDSLISPEHRIERVAAKTAKDRERVLEAIGAAPQGEADEDVTDESGKERRTRRRRRRSTRRREDGEAAEAGVAETDDSAAETAADSDGDGTDEGDSRPRRRRSRRGGRGRSRRPGPDDIAADDSEAAAAERNGGDGASDAGAAAAAEPPASEEPTDGAADAKPARKPRTPPARGRRRVAADPPGPETDDIRAASEPGAPQPDIIPLHREPKPARAAATTASDDAAAAPEPDVDAGGPTAEGVEVVTVDGAANAAGQSRRGWWNRSRS